MVLRLPSDVLSRVAQDDAERFYTELAGELHSFASAHLPEIQPEDREPRIRHVFQLCQHYGIETMKDITRLSHILLAFPADYFQQPQYQWVHAVLAAPDSPTARVDRLSAALRT